MGQGPGGHSMYRLLRGLADRVTVPEALWPLARDVGRPLRHRLDLDIVGLGVDLSCCAPGELPRVPLACTALGQAVVKPGPTRE